MKKILNDLSKLASEAAATGHTALAKRIDSILKAAEEFPEPPSATGDQNLEMVNFLPEATYAAKYNEYLKLDTGEKILFQKQNPEFAARLKKGLPNVPPASEYPYKPEVAKSIFNRNQKEEIARGHEKAKTILLSIMKMYNEARKPPPFLIPSGTLSGQAILDILKMAGMGSKLTGWADLYERLEALKTKTRDYLSGIDDDPFQAGASAPSKSVAPPTPFKGRPAYESGPPLSPSTKETPGFVQGLPRDPTERPALTFPLDKKQIARK